MHFLANFKKILKKRLFSCWAKRSSWYKLSKNICVKLTSIVLCYKSKLRVSLLYPCSRINSRISALTVLLILISLTKSCQACFSASSSGRSILTMQGVHCSIFFSSLRIVSGSFVIFLGTALFLALREVVESKSEVELELNPLSPVTLPNQELDWVRLLLVDPLIDIESLI